MSAPRCVPSLATPGLLALAPPGLLTLAALGFLALAAPAAMAWSTGPTFDCSSNDRRTVHCPVDTRGGVVLLRQHSRAPCIEGDSWGWDRRGVWVSAGCRGEFAVGGGGYGPPGHGGGWHGAPGWGGGPGWSGGPGRRVCESIGQQTAWCPMDTRRGVWLVQQFSRAACIEGRTWGWDRRGVWVSHGCRAEFESAGPGGGPGWGPGPGPGWGGGSGWAPPPQTVRCESSRGRVQHCAVGPVRSIRLQRQLSRGECREGYSWGWDRGMLWVSHGCRGEFVVW